jgi:potassium efflux system protein
MNTELITFENETLIIPNSKLTGGIIHNYSYKDRSVVIINNVDVSYNSNLDEVITILKEVASRNPWLRTGSDILVRVKTFADSGISMQLRTWIMDVEVRAEAQSWTNLEIWRAFKRHNVEIPFPQRVVHQRTMGFDDLSHPESRRSTEAVNQTSDASDITRDNDDSSE